MKVCQEIRIWFKLGEKISGTSIEDLGTFYYCWQHKFAMSIFIQHPLFLYCWLTCNSTQHTHTHKVHCCISVATVKTCRSVVSHVHSLSCLLWQNQVFAVLLKPGIVIILPFLSLVCVCVDCVCCKVE